MFIMCCLESLCEKGCYFVLFFLGTVKNVQGYWEGGDGLRNNHAVLFEAPSIMCVMLKCSPEWKPMKSSGKSGQGTKIQLNADSVAPILCTPGSKKL